jgi:integrase/recombinase XerD
MRVEKVLEPKPGGAMVRLVDDDEQPVAEVTEFLDLLATRGHSPNTTRAYAYDLLKLFRFLQERELTVAEFTPARAVEFLRWLRVQPSTGRAQRLHLGVAGSEGRLLAPQSCNRTLAAISTFYEFLLTTERFDGRGNPIVKTVDTAAERVAGRRVPPLATGRAQRPIRRALRVKTIDPLPRPIPMDVFDKLIAATRCRRDRALLELMFEGGLRPGEVLGLRLEDVSYGRRRVVIRHREDHPRGVRQKSRRERVVDLHEGRAQAAVNDYVLHERPQDTGRREVFLVSKGRHRGEALGYDGLARMFARTAERAGVRTAWLSPHALRHTHATRMFEGGMRELTLMARLGHASPDSLRVYTRVADPEVLADYRAALGDR